MIEYKFQDVEITLGNTMFLCSGIVDYWIEDCSVGWVPYGNTQVWHPGDGDCVVIESLSIDKITNEDGDCLMAQFPSGNRKRMSMETQEVYGEFDKLLEKRIQRLEEAVADKLSDGDELIEYAKKRNEL